MKNGKINIALLWAKHADAITSVNDLVLGLDPERFNVIFIYLSGYGVERNLIEQAGYKVVYLCEAVSLKVFHVSILWKLVKILRAHEIDILHCHAHKPTVYGAVAAAFARTPVVMAHVHGMGRSANFRRKLTNFLLFRGINRIVAVAEGVKKDILRNNWFLSERKLWVLENSVDYRRFVEVSTSAQEARQKLGVPSDSFVIGTIGRLAPTKGLSYLVEAFTIVKRQMPRAHLVLIGDGPSREQLQRQSDDTPCSDSIHFLGRRANVENLLPGMDIFALSSVAEGMPRVILEAMAARVPCIATRVGGVPEVINSERVGWLVRSKDPEALAAAMMTVASMPEKELEEIIDGAQERVCKFYAHEVVRQKLLNMYESEFETFLKRGGGSAGPK